MMAVTPEEILQRIETGDIKALEQLYNLFADKVYNTALSYAQNREDAEEITQDVFLKINKYAATFKGDSKVSTWVYRIAVNTALNFIKRKKRFAFLQLNQNAMIVSNFEHPGVLLDNKEEAQVLFNCIKKLPESQQIAFILCFVEELPRKEVALIMETSLKAVESLLQRGKENLRKLLDKKYPGRRNSR
jgi:RNA polymerase sigma-70 factor (ECF subfamily)